MTRSVLVTGGNRGIGLTIARAMAESGDKVAITYRSGEPPAEFFAVRCDVTDSRQIDAAFTDVESQQGPVSVVVANAGITRDRLAVRTTDEDFIDVLEPNLVGAFRTARRAIPGMLAQRRGRLVFVSSSLALMGSAGQANYAASKTGLIGLARSLAWELGTRGITANVVAPGLIDTEMGRTVSERRYSKLIDSTAVGRIGRPEEVAAAVRFLAGDEASYVTGAVLPVGGGLGVGY
ncbi:MAG TPA: SDR family oxidoreductase [Pseudonocardiaceae bacterium]|jgi:3-oxoacyl-[acyl-carrier protein] reductase|nr:SDR family oxidoreductase [Pseudonocardiaceae bacterium]